MPHHHCCIPGCRSDNRNNKKYSIHPHVKFFCIPSAMFKQSLHLQWVEKIGRPDLVISRNTRICSRHFVDSRPTPENPSPTVHLRDDAAQTRDRFSKRRDDKCALQGDLYSCKYLNEELEQGDTNSYYMPDVKTVMYEYKTTQTENADAKSVYVDTTDLLHMPSVLSEVVNDGASEDYGKSLRFVRKHQRKRPRADVFFGIEVLKNDTNMMKFYTGLPTYAAFRALLNETKTKLKFTKDLTVSGKKNAGTSITALSLGNEFLMALISNHLGLVPQDLAYRFGVPIDIVHCILSTWQTVLEKSAA